MFGRSRRSARPRNWETRFAILAVIASVALVAWGRQMRPETPQPQSPALQQQARDSGTEEAAAAPTCREVLQRTGKDPVGTCRAGSGVLLTIGPQSRPLVVGPLTTRVRSAELTPATTAAGRARARARLSVGLSVLNHSATPVDVTWSLIDLSVGGIRVAPDRAAADIPGGWPGELTLAAGGRRSGELRFETAGTVTRRLIATGRADLAVRLREDRLGVVRLQPTTG